MKNKTAFSIAELSVVILIIGMLIAGLAQSSLMIKRSKLAAAQSLTQNSIVNKIPNLVVWYETSMESSFDKVERVNGALVSTWYDNNPNAVIRQNATQATAGNQPLFYENVFNAGIPGVRFDGSDDFMLFDGSALLNTSYTIFIVEQRRDNAANLIIGGTATTADANLFLGYEDNVTIAQGHYGSDLHYTISGFDAPAQKMHTFYFNSSSGKKYWLNGGANPDAAEVAQTGVISSYAGSALGRYAAQYFNGDLAEIIIFTRALGTEERRSVEDYLSKKYSIDIS